MSVLTAFILFAAAMIASAVFGVSMLAALAVGLVCFILAALKLGHSFKSLVPMMWSGIRRSFVVMRVLIVIGILTAAWRSSGVIALFVYYGVKLITPNLFIVIAFVLSAVLSYAIGTSFGVIGTVGVIMMTIARAGGVNEIMTAGAVMSGAYFGDRCSPASSCANLVAGVTGTKLYSNVSAMLRSAVIPTVAALLAYAALSVFNPSSSTDAPLMASIEGGFALPFYVIIPAVIMLALPAFKVNVLIAMGASILSALLLSVFLQGQSLVSTLVCCFSGYTPSDPALASTFSGGGIVSMLNVCGILLISSSYAGVFEGTHMLDQIQGRLSRLADKIGPYETMLISGTGCAAVFCNQTIAVLMADQLLKGAYDAHGLSKETRALDISDSLVLTSGIVPWSIACALPLAMLETDVRALPFAFLLYFVPLYRLIRSAVARRRNASH